MVQWTRAKARRKTGHFRSQSSERSCIYRSSSVSSAVTFLKNNHDWIDVVRALYVEIYRTFAFIMTSSRSSTSSHERKILRNTDHGGHQSMRHTH